MTLIALTLIGALSAFAITLRLAAPRPRPVPIRGERRDQR